MNALIQIFPGRNRKISFAFTLFYFLGTQNLLILKFYPISFMNNLLKLFSVPNIVSFCVFSLSLFLSLLIVENNNHIILLSLVENFR